MAAIDFNEPVAVRDMADGDVLRFANIYDCAQYFGDTPDRVLQHKEALTPEIYLGHYHLSAFVDGEFFFPKFDYRDSLLFLQQQRISVGPWVLFDIKRDHCTIAYTLKPLAGMIKWPEAKLHYPLQDQKIVTARINRQTMTVSSMRFFTGE